MFFADRIKSIRPGDSVLEIGPGSTPYLRANEFLEYRFTDVQQQIAQRGNIRESPEFGHRIVHFYDGGRFPFKDKQFDYVIASHVVEHTADPTLFMDEIFRVGGGRGYLEYPLPSYEYLFDFDVHLCYIWFDAAINCLRYVRKNPRSTGEFSSVTTQLRRSLELGWDDLVRNNLPYFAEGFEFFAPFTVCEASSLKAYSFSWETSGRAMSRRVMRKLETFLPG